MYNDEGATYRNCRDAMLRVSNLESYKEALDIFDKVLQFKPDYYDAWYLRATTLKNLGHCQEAISSYEKALQFKTDKHEEWNNIIKILSTLPQLFKPMK